MKIKQLYLEFLYKRYSLEWKKYMNDLIYNYKNKLDFPKNTHKLPYILKKDIRKKFEEYAKIHNLKGEFKHKIVLTEGKNKVNMKLEPEVPKSEYLDPPSPKPKTIIPRELTKEEIQSGWHLTVGKLKMFLEEYKLSDDAPILIQRVEDFYYENNNWGVYLKEDYQTNYAISKNPDVDPREFMNQYTPAFSTVNYLGDEDILFIDLHY